MVAEAERIRDTYGITTFKVKVGRDPIDDDVAACRALREALGPTSSSTSTATAAGAPRDAARALREMADLDLDLRRGALPRRRRARPALAGRPEHRSRCSPTRASSGPARSPASCSAASATGISIKTVPHRLHRRPSASLALCEGLGVDVVIGNQIDGQIGSLCAAAFGAAFARTSRRAGELSNFLDMTDDLLAEPLEIEGGHLAVRQGAGLGIEIDEDKLSPLPHRTPDSPVPSPATHTAKWRPDHDHDTITEQDAKAAATGADATRTFQEKAAAPSGTSTTERVDTLVAERCAAALHDVIGSTTSPTPSTTPSRPG